MQVAMGCSASGCVLLGTPAQDWSTEIAILTIGYESVATLRMDSSVIAFDCRTGDVTAVALVT